MKKTGTIIAVSVVVLLVVGAIIFNRQSYKGCWNCDAAGYFDKGLKNACSDRPNHRRAALDFIGRAAAEGALQAEIFLAELYSDNLPQGCVGRYSEQTACLRRDVEPDREKALAAFTSVAKALEDGQEADPVVSADLGLLYLQGVLPADRPKEKAMSFYAKAAEAGNFAAMRLLARMENERGNYVEARQWLTRAAEDPTDAASLLMLGDYALYGKGQTVDYGQAEKFYAKGLERVAQAATADETAAELKNTLSARLDMVRRKLAQAGNSGEPVTVSYHLDGSVSHFYVYAQDQPEAYIGEVINRDGTVSAVLNKDLAFAKDLQEGSRQGFDSMNQGMFWILNTYAAATHGNEGAVFRFVLTKS